MLEAGGLERLLADPKAIKEAVVFAAATGGVKLWLGFLEPRCGACVCWDAPVLLGTLRKPLTHPPPSMADSLR